MTTTSTTPQAPATQPAGTSAPETPDTPTALNTIDQAIAALRAGRPIIVVDDEDRENEGDLIMPAATVTAEWMGFIIRHSSGVVCAPMTAERARAMELPPMVANNQDPKGTAYTVSCDAAAGTSTGISAADRALTAQVLADPAALPTQLHRPGHVFPLIAKDGGVRERAGHTEAGVEFARLAGFEPVAVIAEVVHDEGPMMRLDDLRPFARLHGLMLVSIEELIAYLDARDMAGATEAAAGDRITAGAATSTDPVVLPTEFGTFTARAWTVDGVEHLSLSAAGSAEAAGADVAGAGATADSAGADVAGAEVAGAAASATESDTPVAGDAGQSAPLVRVHSECLTGDVFASHRCDCGEQLAAGLRAIASAGGTLIYLRGQEGRGIGLFNKLRAYALQDGGLDTVDANTHLGLPVDARDYAAAAAILTGMGIRRVRLLTNNPAKVSALAEHGIEVAERVSVDIPARAENAAYLRTKRDRMHHLIGGTGVAGAGVGSAGVAGAPDARHAQPAHPDLAAEHSAPTAAASALIERKAS
ncbi:3,4-dihydroxy-2-butanone-4-phosphate synthase [Brevibacterium moorei]|uniref:3,4-dihydroxy-2-butanone-4-phosphate synthase n=1 Tax=Brevibacterium moorei TaxID=2968457 RepID=UPI00211BC313|nr:3,4-dihydroxy-2-butanone-4-phosphate synthase [Brevibacterium sp. 68QC2CO]MCQ9386502.1 3,4-dihydroxy-2-butanone-4-phosphate synthase [Brevibacterium sp. 68QC2CO]